MAVSDISADLVRSLVRYEPETGMFFWIAKASTKTNVTIGARADRFWADCGYHKINIRRNALRANRAAWMFSTGSWPSGQIDHINGDKTDNRISNLRDVSGSVNQQNKTRAKKNNSTGLLGVSKFGGKFFARIWVEKRSVHLGTFEDKHAAHLAYLEAKRAMHSGCTI